MELVDSSSGKKNNVLGTQEVLGRLAKVGINITAQTLRNWERDQLITSPTRGAGYGGKWSEYPNYVLAECYAAHMLLQVLPKKIIDKDVPKFSVKLLAEARANCEHRQSKPYDAAETLSRYNSGFKFGKAVVTDMPIKWSEMPKIELSNEYVIFANKAGQNTFETMLQFTTKKSAELFWLKYYSEGLKIFGLTE